MQAPINSNMIKVASWNMGDDADYIKVHQRANVPLDMNNINPTLSKRDELIKETISKYGGHIYCLQEVGQGLLRSDKKDEYRINKWLDPNKYAWYSGDNHDTVVAWDKERFEIVSNTDPTRADGKASRSNEIPNTYTLVELRDKQTNQVIRVASAHIPSCHPMPEKNQAGKYDEDVVEADAHVDHLVKEMERLDKISKADALILGMDANSASSYTRRFKALNDSKFISDGQNTVTNFSKHAQTKLKIDYVFAKGLTHALTLIKPNSEDIPLLEIDNPKQNPSDHRPVFTYVNVSPKKGIFKSIFG